MTTQELAAHRRLVGSRFGSFAVVPVFEPPREPDRAFETSINPSRICARRYSKSLRNQLLLWQDLTLLAVVGGLGTFVYLWIEMATMSVVDSELESIAQQTLVTFRAVSRDELQRGDFELPMVNLRR